MEDMPFREKDEPCVVENKVNAIPNVRILGARFVPRNDKSLQAAVVKGPISVTIYVGKSMVGYFGGVYF